MPDFCSGGGCFAISRSGLTRNFLSFALALLLGFSGGVGGGLVAGRLDRPPAAVAEPAGTPSASAATATTATTAADRVRSALDSVLPAIVTVVVELPSQRLADGRLLERRNIGSGVVVSDAGHVITNFHVVDGAEQIRVILATGEQRPATPLSDDSPFTDLAVLLVPPGGLRTASFGDSAALRSGDAVLAIARGRLSDAAQTVSAGVISSLGRAWARNGVILEDLVQTDAAVNPGDSGGALINLDGEFVGLLTTVVRTDASGRAVQGVAFAQSSNSLRPVVERIVERGAYPRARPGIERPGRQHLEISPELAVEQGLPVLFGALVVAPAPGSPAEAAGLRPGDIVVAMNGIAVDFDNPLPNLLKRLAAGADAELLMVRDSRELLITVSPWAE